MRLTQIKIDSFLSLNHIDLSINTPLISIVGPNGAGKSSIVDAINLALADHLPRIPYKRDSKELITAGLRKGAIEIKGYHQDKDYYAAVELPGLKVKADHQDLFALPYVLNPPLLASLSVNDLRVLLFKLTKTQSSQESIRQRMIDKGLNPAMIEEVMPVLRSGFPAGHEYAKEQISQIKGSWKAVTSELYGCKKAESWRAPLPDKVPNNGMTKDLEEALIKRSQMIGSLNQRLGEMRTKKEISDKQATDREYLQAKADEYDAHYNHTLDISKQINLLSKEIEAYQKSAQTSTHPDAQQCPCCQAALIVDDNGLLIKAPRAKGDDSMQILMTLEAEHQDLLKQKAECELALNESAQCKSRLSQYTQIDITNSDIDTLKKQIEDLNTTYQQDSERLSAYKSAIKDFEMAQNANQKAAHYHALIGEWTKVMQLLAPDGLPSELLSQSLTPINRRLQQSAEYTQWMTVRINGDMSITANGLSYYLLSESERWRADLMLAEAVSTLSGLKCLMIDRFDVIDVPDRATVLNYLMELATIGDLECGLLLGTLKAPLPDFEDLLKSYWIESGQLRTPERSK